MSCPAEKDLAGVRAQHAGQKIDQRRLAGAVRPDQRVARAFGKPKRDVGSDDERAEALEQSARGQRAVTVAAGVAVRAHVAALARRASNASPPRMPFGTSITTAMSRRPIQKYQNCGLSPENWSRATM